jgi:hypothetical protein
MFVDASLRETDGPLTVRVLRPAAGELVPIHFSEPAWLLGICQALYGLCPEAWLLAIPAAEVELGEELSAVAWAGVEAALAFIACRFPTRCEERTEGHVFGSPRTTYEHPR